MSYFENLGAVLNGSISGVWGIFANFVPTLLLAIVLFAVGMIVASVIGRAIAQVINVTKVDKLFESAGAKEFLAKAGLTLNIGKFFGVIVKWFIAIVFLMASLQIVGLTQVSGFIGEMILSYLPVVIITAIILMLATVIADATKNIVLTSAKAVKISSAEALSSIAKYAIWIFAIMIILPQFGIDPKITQILFGGIIGALALALGLSFGLGGKEAASRVIENISKDLSNK